jgi:hypothetical protein
MARPSTAVLTLTACVTALAGCDASTEASAETTPRASPHQLTLTNGLTVLVGADNHSPVPALRVTGKITEIDGSCLGFSDGRTTWVLVVDHGSTVTADGLGVVTPAGATIHVGDTVAGGVGSSVDGTGLEEEWTAALPACLTGRSLYPVSVSEPVA